MLEGGSSVFKTKGDYSIIEYAPRGCECSLVMILFPDLNLVISRKSILEGKGLMSSARIDDLVNERCLETVFGTCPIKVAEVYVNTNGTLFFIHGNRIRNPSYVCNGINEVGYA